MHKNEFGEGSQRIRAGRPVDSWPSVISLLMHQFLIMFSCCDIVYSMELFFSELSSLFCARQTVCVVPSCTLITSHCNEPLEKLQDKLDQCSSLPQIGVCLAMHCMYTDGIFLGLGKNYPNAKSVSKSVIFFTKLC